MGERQSSRDQAPVAPGRDIWGDDYHPSTRPPDGGGYGQQAQAHLAADGLVREGERLDPLAGEAPGGAPDSWWSQGIKNSGT
jgi:hypothetical protein